MSERFKPTDDRSLGDRLTDEERIEIEDRLNGTAEGDFLLVTPQEELEWKRLRERLSGARGRK